MLAVMGVIHSLKKNYLLIEEKENEEEISFLTGKRNGIWNTDGRTDFL